MFLEPCEPPKTKTVGVPLSSLKYSFAPKTSFMKNYFLIGLPTTATLFLEKYSAEPAKDTAILLANFPAQALALPGIASDSCIITGIPKILAAQTRGKLPYPPLQKTTSGKSKYIPNTDFTIPGNSLTASMILRKEKYLLI